jgi:hypothetical protein
LGKLGERSVGLRAGKVIDSVLGDIGNNPDDLARPPTEVDAPAKGIFARKILAGQGFIDDDDSRSLDRVIDGERPAAGFPLPENNPE